MEYKKIHNTYFSSLGCNKHGKIWARSSCSKSSFSRTLSRANEARNNASIPVEKTHKYVTSKGGVFTVIFLEKMP